MQNLVNPLSANPTKWSNTLKQFVVSLVTNCLSAFDHFVILVLKGLEPFTFFTKWFTNPKNIFGRPFSLLRLLIFVKRFCFTYSNPDIYHNKKWISTKINSCKSKNVSVLITTCWLLSKLHFFMPQNVRFVNSKLGWEADVNRRIDCSLSKKRMQNVKKLLSKTDKLFVTLWGLKQWLTTWRSLT